ncbi:MAG: hypothetical protein H0V84_12515, partial [Actinobacteria bacterium]|nr:hypothetical protein [Actinomycetota bacterium]
MSVAPTLLRFALLIAVAAAIAAPAAHAFDTAAHFDVTGDALRSEGFGEPAVQTTQVNNWFQDLYVNSGDIPQSGHAAWWKVLFATRWWLGEVEDWSPRVIEAASSSHFDSHDGGWGYRNTQSIEGEFDRLLRATVRVCRAARPSNPLRCLTALGASLHEVQDFYAHTNWVETRYGRRPGIEGPGWSQRGFGTAPTWFDIPADLRNAARVYTNGPKDGKIDYRDPLYGRSHGAWKSDSNKNLATSMNKDWPGRPLYLEAYLSAYFATRQWTQAVRGAVGDDAFWSRMRTFAPAGSTQAALRHDVRRGARGMSYWVGHWQGEGEPRFGEAPGPGGSLDDAYSASKEYFARSPTIFRRTFERVVPLLHGDSGPLRVVIPASRPLRNRTQFVRLRITKLKGTGAGDVGPDEADFYALAGIGGQPYLSAFLHGYDSFSFRRPHYPFTFLKAVDVGARFLEPLHDLQVEVTTANDEGAGTDDNVYLRINDTTRFQLDKVGSDDFERGDRATYSLRVDA